MKTLEELKQYYSNATKEEIIFDNYQDMLRVVELQQEKEDLIEFLKKQIETKKQHNAFNKYFYEIKEIEAFLEKVGE